MSGTDGAGAAEPRRLELLSRRGALLLLAGVLAAAAATILVAALIADRVGRPFEHFTRDQFATLDGPAYIGIVSSIGILLWWGAAVACLVAAALVRRGAAARALLAAGLLSAYLAVDDLFGLHEQVYAEELGIPQWLVYLVYMLGVVAVGVRHREFIRRTQWVLLAGAGVFFAASVGVDVVGEATEVHRNAAEDSFKLLGIAAWATYLTLTSLEVARGWGDGRRAGA